MTDQQRMRRREELREQVYGKKRTTCRTKEERANKAEGRKGMFWFQVYVMMIVCGGILLLSFFHTETSEHVTKKIKEVIAQELPAEMMEQIKTKVTVFCEQNQIALPYWQEDAAKEHVSAP